MADKKEEKKAADKGKDGAAATPEDEAKKKKKKLLIMAIGGVVLAGAIGGGAMMFLGKKKAAPAPGAPAGEALEGEKKPDGEHGGEKKEGDAGEPADGKKAEGADAQGGDKKEGAAAGAQSGEKKADAGSGGDKKDGEGESSDSAPDFGQTYSFAPFNINLGNPMDNHYARMEVTVEFFGGPEQESELKKRLPQLRDAIVSVASKKSREFLLGPDGKDQLRLEIKNRLNQYMTRKIENVYITDILIE